MGPKLLMEQLLRAGGLLALGGSQDILPEVGCSSRELEELLLGHPAGNGFLGYEPGPAQL